MAGIETPLDIHVVAVFDVPKICESPIYKGGKVQARSQSGDHSSTRRVHNTNFSTTLLMAPLHLRRALICRESR